MPGGVTLIAPPNYVLHYQSGNLVVGKALLKATAQDTSRTYGADNPVFAMSYTGFINGDSVSAITAPVAGTTATVNSPVGQYPIILTGGIAANYIIQDSNATLTITKANLTATADNQSRVYGDPNPAFTISYNGFLNGDDPTKISPPVAGTIAGATSPAGQYPITLSGGSALNYTLRNVAGILNVSPAALTVQANDAGISTGDNLPVFTSTITGFKNGESNTIIGGPLYTVNPVFVNSLPGTYSVTPYGLQLTFQNNYAITYLSGTLYVNDKSGKNVVPKLDCVEPLTNDPSGLPYAAHFSYNNPNSTLVYVPIGINNVITTSGKYSGQQPTVFQPGSGQFKIYFDGSKMTWTLTTYNGNHNSSVAAVASSTSSKCSSGTGTLQTGVQYGMSAEAPAETIDPASAVYPNPAQDMVTIYIKDGFLSAKNIQIVDAYGKVYPVSGKKISDHSLQVDMSRLSRGMYFICVLVDNEFKVFRVLKM